VNYLVIIKKKAGASIPWYRITNSEMKATGMGKSHMPKKAHTNASLP
jgi:hypothetical protein